MVAESYIGRKFGKLEVVGVEKIKTHKYFLCKCDCGNKELKLVRRDHLLNHDIESCGCKYNERTYSNVPKPTFVSKENYYLGTTFDGRTFLIDSDDYNLVSLHCWYFDKYGYLIATISGKKVKLHQYILHHPGAKIDHINRDKSDNRKCNLRIASDCENAINRSIGCNNDSGVVGVGFHKQSGLWRARITVNGSQIYLGSFINKDDAIVARLKAEAKYFGEYAPQKHLYNQYHI